MTMVTKDDTVPAGQFKAKCLALLDQVARTHRPLVVTKRGKPVARIVPLQPLPSRGLRRSVVEYGDIVSPLGDEWEAGR
jgi:prevent-host-death family protein